MVEAASMTRTTHPLKTICTGLAMSAAATVAQAQSLLATPGASPWQVEKGGRLRLVTSPADPSGTAHAAIEIELDSGFKTYWWNPGPDGIPPQVSFFGSRNVAKAQLTLPPPHVFRETTVTVGYKGKIAFPVRIEAKDPASAYRLSASGILGFCADICVPVPFQFAATPKAKPGQSAIVASAGTSVVEPSDTLGLTGARYDKANGRLEVDAKVPDTDVLLELVVANPDDRLLPAAATSVRQEGEDATFSFDIGQDIEIEDGEALTFTLVVAQFGQAGRIGVEQKLRVKRTE